MQSLFKISTKGNTDIINITDKVQEIIKESKIKNGIVNVFVRHTTAGITIMEYEPGLVKDLKDIFEKIFPVNSQYSHNKLNNDDNGSAHLKTSILGNSLCIPFSNGKMLLGTWQSIVLIDFDTHTREREVVVSVVGE